MTDGQLALGAGAELIDAGAVEVLPSPPLVAQSIASAQLGTALEQRNLFAEAERLAARAARATTRR